MSADYCLLRYTVAEVKDKAEKVVIRVRASFKSVRNRRAPSVRSNRLAVDEATKDKKGTIWPW